MTPKRQISGLLPAVWDILDGRLWHATSLSAARGILPDSSIRPDLPDVPYPGAFCRSRGWVSLFDFSGDIEEIDGSHDWHGWLSSNQIRKPLAVWLEIDRPAVASAFISPTEIWRHWMEGGHRGKFIQYVEAAHSGPLPASAIVGALAIDVRKRERHHWLPGAECLLDRLEAYAAALLSPDSEPLTFGDKLALARAAQNIGMISKRHPDDAGGS